MTESMCLEHATMNQTLWEHFPELKSLLTLKFWKNDPILLFWLKNLKRRNHYQIVAPWEESNLVHSAHWIFLTGKGLNWCWWGVLNTICVGHNFMMLSPTLPWRVRLLSMRNFFSYFSHRRCEWLLTNQKQDNDHGESWVSSLDIFILFD